jgi:hypothetical protein
MLEFKRSAVLAVFAVDRQMRALFAGGDGWQSACKLFSL